MLRYIDGGLPGSGATASWPVCHLSFRERGGLAHFALKCHGWRGFSAIGHRQGLALFSGVLDLQRHAPSLPRSAAHQDGDARRALRETLNGRRVTRARCACWTRPRSAARVVHGCPGFQRKAAAMERCLHCAKVYQAIPLRPDSSAANIHYEGWSRPWQMHHPMRGANSSNMPKPRHRCCPEWSAARTHEGAPGETTADFAAYWAQRNRQPTLHSVDAQQQGQEQRAA